MSLEEERQHQADHRRRRHLQEERQYQDRVHQDQLLHTEDRQGQYRAVRGCRPLTAEVRLLTTVQHTAGARLQAAAHLTAEAAVHPLTAEAVLRQAVQATAPARHREDTAEAAHPAVAEDTAEAVLEDADK